MSEPVPVTPDSPAALINRELSWLSFARRVLALAEDPEQPLLERVKFAGIMGMIYDEFAMKRIGGLFRQARPSPPRRWGEQVAPPRRGLEGCYHHRPGSPPRSHLATPSARTIRTPSVRSLMLSQSFGRSPS